MAAICCQICTAPCKALGYCCSACDKGCSAVCKGFCSCCNCCPEDRPSPLFLTYTLLFNLPVAIVGLVVALSNVSDWNDCDTFINAVLWLLIQSGLAIFFIAFGVRLYILFARPYTSRLPLNAQQERSHDDSFGARCTWFLCHDVLVFLYFFAGPGAFIWSCLGLGVAADVSQNEDSDECSDSVKHSAWALSVIMLLYLFGTLVVGAISCCLEGSRSSGHSERPQHQAPTYPAMQHLFAPTFSTQQAHGGEIPYADVPPSAYQAPSHQQMPPSGGHSQNAHATMQQYYSASKPGTSNNSKKAAVPPV